MGVNCTRDNEGGESEMRRRIETAITELDPNDDDELNDIARVIQEGSWENPRKVVDILHSDNEEDSERAALVLMNIGDLPMTPLLELIDRSKPESLVWDMEMAVKIQLENRNRIVRILDQMLLDKRVLKEPESPLQVEEIPPSRRVCDDAYLMMRSLFALQEDEEELLTNTDVFLDMSDEQRDAEIDRAKETKKWISLVEKALEEDEFE
jgi:hypothetical protein